MNEFVDILWSWNNDLPDTVVGVFVDNNKLTVNLGGNARGRQVMGWLLESTPELKYVGNNGFREYTFEWVA
jgi:hypothetical protein